VRAATRLPLTLGCSWYTASGPCNSCPFSRCFPQGPDRSLSWGEAARPQRSLFPRLPPGSSSQPLPGPVPSSGAVSLSQTVSLPGLGAALTRGVERGERPRAPATKGGPGARGRAREGGRSSGGARRSGSVRHLSRKRSCPGGQRRRPTATGRHGHQGGRAGPGEPPCGGLVRRVQLLAAAALSATGAQRGAAGGRAARGYAQGRACAG